MSLKIFFLNTFGIIPKIQKIESHYNQMEKAFSEFAKLQGSNDLALFLKLDERVNSLDFKNKKAEIEKLQYKGSKEQADFDAFTKLDNDPKFKAYYAIVESDDFKRFQELQSSYLIKEFIDMRSYVDNEYEREKSSFMSLHKNDSEEFEGTMAYKKHLAYTDLLKSDDVQFWINYPKTKEHTLYKEYVNLDLRSRYEELKLRVNSAEFIKRKEFLENPNRWETSDEYSQIKQYEQMKNEARFQAYLKNKNSLDLSFFEKYTKVFDDNFDTNSVNTEFWQKMEATCARTLGKPFSLVGDMQAYTESENTSVTNGILKIETRKENTNSLEWKMPQGFVPQTFEYSSGSLSTINIFEANNAIFEVKLKYNPNPNMVDVIYLINKEGSLRINLLEMGKVCRVGYCNKEKQANSSIKGITKGADYILRLEWDLGNLTWKINNYKVMSAKINPNIDPLSLNIKTIVLNKNAKTPHSLEIDWVRVFTKK